MREVEEKPCHFCGTLFEDTTQRGPRPKYCSASCRLKMYRQNHPEARITVAEVRELQALRARLAPDGNADERAAGADLSLPIQEGLHRETPSGGTES